MFGCFRIIDCFEGFFVCLFLNGLKEHVVAVFFDLEKAYDTTWTHSLRLRHSPLLAAGSRRHPR